MDAGSSYEAVQFWTLSHKLECILRCLPNQISFQTLQLYPTESEACQAKGSHFLPT